VYLAQCAEGAMCELGIRLEHMRRQINGFVALADCVAAQSDLSLCGTKNANSL
jgi:hypothetical protein